jgi:tetratricopeptide (TPR) repeat protein
VGVFRPYRIIDAVVAFYRPGPDRDYIVMQPIGGLSHSVMVHEFVHLLLARSGGRYPLWLNEGIAEYFATLPQTGSTVAVGRASRNRLRDLASGKRLSLERLFAVTYNSPEYRTSEHGGVFYAQSWALTHMLRSDPRYRDRTGAFLSMVRGGTPSARALTTVYGRSLPDIQRDLESYLFRRQLPTQEVRFDEPPKLAKVPTREVAPFEAGLVTANVFAAAREDADKARAAFADLATENPDDLSLLDSRASLELRTGRAAAARPYLARAVELGATDAATYRNFAALLASEDPTRAEALFEKSLQIDPSSVRTRVQLAALVAERNPSLALNVLEPVDRATVTDAFEVMRLRTTAYLAVDDLDRAHEAARDMVQLAVTRQRRSVAARLMSSVEERLAAKNESRQASATADVHD